MACYRLLCCQCPHVLLSHTHWYICLQEFENELKSGAEGETDQKKGQ